MITAEGADGIDHLVHFPQWHAIHLLVQRIEVCFDLVVVIRVPFIMTVVQHFQDGVRFAKVWRIPLNMLFQNFKIGFHKHHTP